MQHFSVYGKVRNPSDCKMLCHESLVINVLLMFALVDVQQWISKRCYMHVFLNITLIISLISERNLAVTLMQWTTSLHLLDLFQHFGPILLPCQHFQSFPHHSKVMSLLERTNLQLLFGNADCSATYFHCFYEQLKQLFCGRYCDSLCTGYFYPKCK